MQVTIYRTDDDANVVPKSKKQIQKYDNVQPYDDFSIINPIVVLGFQNIENFAKANYAYINELKRYYYITDVVIENQRIILKMRVDPLESFWDELKRIKMCITRQENLKSNPFIDDEKISLRANLSYGVKKLSGGDVSFLANPNSATAHNFILNSI